MKTWQDIKTERDKNTNSVSTKWQDIVSKRGGTQKFSDYNNDSTENSRVLPKPNKEVKKIVPKTLKKNDTLTTQAQRTGVNGRPLPLLDAKNLDKASGVASAITQNALDSATLGLSTKGLDLITNNGATKSLNEAKKENPIASTVGNLAGYALPFAGAEKIVAKGAKAAIKVGAKPIKNKLIKTAVKGASEGAIIGGVEAKIKGNDVVDSAKNMALLGAGGNLAIGGISKLVGKVLKPRVFEKIEPKTETPKAEVSKVKGKVQTTLSGSKFKVNNPQYEKAMTKYNDAIETIQNNYGHFQLTPEETLDVLRNSKQKFGFDFKGILKDMSKYENKLNLKEISNRQNQKYVYGVENRITPKLKLPGKPIEQPNILTQATTPIGTKVNGTNATEPMPDTLGTISSSLDKKGVKHTVAKAYTEVIDNLDPINRVSKEAYQKALNTRQNDMLSHQILTNKLIDSKGNVIGDSLKDITKDIPIENKTEFADYLKARHAPSWIDQGRTVYPNELGMTSDLARQKATNYETIHPEFKEKADRLVKFQQDLTKKWLVDTGIMKEETWNGLIEKYPDYVPYARDFADIEKGGVYAKRGFVNQGSPIKKGVGSQRNTMDSVETIANRINQYVKIAKRNDVGKTLVNEIRNNPESFNGIAEIVTPKNAEMNSLGIDNINKILETDGIDGVVEKVNSSFENMFSAKKGGAIEKGNNIVTVLENGNPIHLKINDPDLLKAVASLDPVTIPKVFQAVGKATNVMKTLTTGLNPAFGLARNIWKDLVTGYVNSSTINANPLGYAKYIWDLTRAVGNVLGEGAEKSIGKMLPESLDNLLKKSGEPLANFKNIGGGGHASNISADRNLFNDSIKSLYKQKLSVGKVVKSVPKGIYKGLESLNNTMEVSPRLAENKRQLKAGSSNDKALFESQDLTTNFSRHGDTGKMVDSFTAYFNAALQGLDKTTRQFNPANGNAKQVLNSAAKAVYAITIPAMILYAKNHNDPAYNMLSDYQKDNFFNIPNGDGTFKKIPKPREYGVVFGAFPERLLKTFKENDPNGFNRFAENAIQNFAPPNPITENITSPAVRTLSTPEGRDWRNKPILNQNLLSLSPKLQYDENTSEFGKKIGGIANISPKKVDNLAKSYLGGVAQFGIPALTKGKNMADVLKSQFNTDPLYNNDILNDFYKRYDSAKTSTADNNELNNIPSKVKTKQDIIVSKYKRDADYISKLQKMIKSETDKQKVKGLRELILEKAKKSNY